MGEVEAKELYLFIQNDGDLYRQQGLPIIQNLVRKIDRGVYDRTLAVKLYHYLAENGAKKYIKEYGGDKWFEMFDKPTRELVAKNFVADFEAEYKLGNYDNLHEKKYQGKAGILKNPQIAVGDTVVADDYGVKKKYEVLNIGGSGIVQVKNLKSGIRSWKYLQSLKKVKRSGVLSNPAFISDGKKFKTKAFTSVKATNEYLSKHPEYGVIGTKTVRGKEYIHVALNADNGKRIKRNPPYGYGTHENPASPFKWSTFAGGTSAAEGKHGYDTHLSVGTYSIQPVTTQYGRHAGYLVHFINDKGVLVGGLWQQIGKFHSPNAAKKASREHFEKHFSKNML
jgi:hypothetical protein